MALPVLKTMKANWIEPMVDREAALDIGNSARLLVSWIDAMVEYTVLKHEALFLTVKKKTVLDKIEDISIRWPVKKHFIESAYKLLLFTKKVKPEISYTIERVKGITEPELYDYEASIAKAQHVKNN